MTASEDKPPPTVPVTEGQPKPTLEEDGEGGDKTAPAGSRRIAWTFLLVIVVVVFAAGFLAATLLAPRLGQLLPWGATAEGTPAAPHLERIAAIEEDMAGAAARLAGIEADLAALAARAAAPDADVEEALAALRRMLEAQAGRIAAIEGSGAAGQIAAIERRLEALAQAGNPQAIAADLLARIEGLERRLGDAADAGDEAGAGRDRRLDELERRLAARPPQAAPEGASTERLAALESALAALAQRLDRAAGGAGPELARGASVLLAAAALRDASRRHAGFAGELAALRQAAAELPTFAAAPAVAALAELEPHAADGAPSVAALAARFRGRAPAIVRAANRDEEAGWVEQTLERVSSVVTVRRVGEVDGDGAEARVARAELRLAAGDLAAAAREIAALEGRAAAAAAAWLASARIRLAVDGATRLLYEAAVRSLLAAVPGE